MLWHYLVLLATWQGVVYVNSTLASSKQTNLPATRPNVPLPVRPRPWNPPAGGAVVNVFDYGAAGDGVHDDTAAIQNAINAAPVGGGVFLPQGMYLVSATITLRSDTFLVGEALSEIHPSATASLWQDASNPAPVMLLPAGGAPMLAEIIFVTVGSVPGAIMLAWQSGAGTGLWDVHWRTMHTTWAMMHVSGTAEGALVGLACFVSTVVCACVARLWSRGLPRKLVGVGRGSRYQHGRQHCGDEPPRSTGRGRARAAVLVRLRC